MADALKEATAKESKAMLQTAPMVHRMGLNRRGPTIGKDSAKELVA